MDSIGCIIIKTQIHQLAYFGGKPLFDAPIHVGRPNIGNREKLLSRINDILDNRWLSNRGPYVREFEDKLSKYLGVKHVISMCNGTVALEIAIRALGLTGEVILPSATFIATAHALQWQEIRPVFADIDPITYNIDPKAVERMITPHTSGVIGVHLWGRCCDVAALEKVAQEHNLKLLFDAAHALGSTYQGKSIGSFGEAEVLSFHATKFINSFEGGAVVTNNDELAEKIRLMQNFGFSGLDNVIYIGTNGKMSEPAAAMGLTSLESIDEFIAANRRNYELYRDAFKGLPAIRFLEYEGTEKTNYQYIVTEVIEKIAGISRDAIIELMHAENIRVRRYFYPGCHRMEPYRSCFPHAGLLLPNTEWLLERVILFPTGTAISPEDIDKVTNLLKFILANSDHIRKNLYDKFSITGKK